MSAEHRSEDSASSAASEAAPGPGPAAAPGPGPSAGVGTGAPVTITVCPDGPLLVRGAYELVDGDDRPIDPGRATVALCRCGASSIKPFCDGSHKRARFRAR